METELLNVVTCGACGKIFAHELGVVELTCPYCRFTEDICWFPDLYLPPDDSIINLKRQ